MTPSASRFKRQAIFSAFFLLAAGLAFFGSTRLVTYAARPVAQSGPTQVSNCGQWSLVPGPAGNGNHLSGITAIAANNAWAVGFAPVSSINPRGQTLTEHWNGTTWSVVPSPNLGSPDLANNVLSAVSPVPGTNHVWAVGAYNAGPIQALIEYWNGTTWRIVPIGANLST